ncbi:MAG: hypothetical protein BMS9Abin33_0719 [Gammaproteobacteria bacterium]|nr:MAG: hypothetical protein BMS9Abin33_0719 [Gammaproteobacteria bacterium]
MFSTCRNIVTVFLFVFSFQAVAAQSDQAVQELYVKSGMKDQLAQMAPAMDMGFQQVAQAKAKGTNQAMISSIRAAMMDAYAPQQLEKYALGHIFKKLKKKDINKVMEWLESGLGKKITKLEKDASTPKARQQLLAYAQSLQQTLPSEQRIGQVVSLMKVTKAAESATEVALGTQKAVMSAMFSAMPQAEANMGQMIISQLEAQRPKLMENMQNQVLLTFLFTYRSLSDEELGQYVAFASTKSGQKYHRVMTEALMRALSEAGTQLGKNMAEIISKNTKVSKK